MTIAELRTMHPMPWTYQADLKGLITMHDAAGGEVGLITILNLACAVTVAQARAPQPAQPASTPSA